MKIRIENVGPVKKIDIDLSKPLIIFTGLNGSGKTYISYIIYSLYALFVYNDDFFGWKQLFSKNIKSKNAYLKTDELFVIFHNNIKLFNEVLPFIFNINKKDPTIKDAQVSLLTTKDEFKDKIREEEFDFSAEDLFVFRKNRESLKYNLKVIGGSDEDYKLVNYIILKGLVFGNVIEDFETSERGGLYTFNKELWLGKKIRHENTNEESIGQEDSNYPLPIKEALNSLGDLTKKFYEKSRYGFLADKIEDEVLKGHLILKKKDEVWYKSHTMGKEIPLSLSSSGVKTICSIILFLRHTAMDCNLIIIDEPELNLHPYNQILVARAFALIVNAGIRLIINTHSDYIIREINNMIMLSSVPKKKIKKLGYTEDNIIYEEDVSPYYFELQTDGKSIIGKEVEVTKTGFSIKLIDDVINNQVSTSQKIYEMMED